jgi:hypothetical protein
MLFEKNKTDNNTPEKSFNALMSLSPFVLLFMPGYAGPRRGRQQMPGFPPRPLLISQSTPDCCGPPACLLQIPGNTLIVAETPGLADHLRYQAVKFGIVPGIDGPPCSVFNRCGNLFVFLFQIDGSGVFYKIGGHRNYLLVVKFQVFVFRLRAQGILPDSPCPGRFPGKLRRPEFPIVFFAGNRVDFVQGKEILSLVMLILVPLSAYRIAGKFLPPSLLPYRGIQVYMQEQELSGGNLVCGDLKGQ